MDNPQLVFRWVTSRGDMILTWKEGLIQVSGRLSTPRERARLEAWIKEHNLTIEGSLEGMATVKAPPETLQHALTDLIGKQVGEVGYLIYGVDRRGRGKALYAKTDIKLEELKEVAKVPQVRGG